MKNMYIRMKKIFYSDIVLVFAFALVPLLAGGLYTLLQGNFIWNLYIPANNKVDLYGIWSDEFSYFKQIEGIIEFGAPQGYFGYDGSIAKMLSLGAWSPVIYIPYVIWGKIFGWNYMSPIICNLVILMFSFALYATCTLKYKYDKMIISCVMLLCTPVTRFIISGMAETVFIGLVVIVVSMFIYLQQNNSKHETLAIVIMLTVIFALSLMRPYYMALTILPAYILWGKEKKLLVLLPLYLGSTWLAYNFIMKNFCAVKLFNTNMVNSVFETSVSQEQQAERTYNIFNVIASVIDKMFKIYQRAVKDVLGIIKASFEGQTILQGKAWCFFFIVVLLLLVSIIYNLIKRRKQEVINQSLCFIIMLTVFSAFIYMTNIKTVGYRHLLSLSILGVFCLANYSPRKLFYPLIIGTIMLSVYEFDSIQMANAFSTEIYQLEVEQRNILYKEKMPLVQGVSWENTISWVYEDRNDETTIYCGYAPLFSIPKGYGIQVDRESALLVNDGSYNINPKYILVTKGGKVQEFLERNEASIIDSGEQWVIYINPRRDNEY